MVTEPGSLLSQGPGSQAPLDQAMYRPHLKVELKHWWGSRQLSKVEPNALSVFSASCMRNEVVLILFYKLNALSY